MPSVAMTYGRFVERMQGMTDFPQALGGAGVRKFSTAAAPFAIEGPDRWHGTWIDRQQAIY
jgi:hypothetical protein